MNIKKLSKSTLFALATTFLLTPLAPPHAHATKITDADGNSISSSGKLHQIYAQQSNSNVALNHFKDFQLSSGEIANMHFNKLNDKQFASILVNLVKNKVDIGGTLNAIRNNTIDGHLIFVSPNGIALTKSGIINAGRFTAMVPTSSHFNKLWNTDIAKFDKNFVQSNIDVNGSADSKLISNSKGIDIQGVINTRSGIALSGNSVNVGDNAKLISKADLDFTELVNLKGVDAGITGNLKATKSSSGDIVLTANAYTTDVLPLGTDAILGGSPTERNNKAVVTMNGTIEADRDVKITATAKQLVTDDTIKLLSDSEQQTGLVWSRLSWAESEVNIGGNINAKNIKVNSNAITTFTDAGNGLISNRGVIDALVPQDNSFKDATNLFNEYVDLSWVVKFNKASINVSDKATLDAKNNLNLAAKANLDVDIAAELPNSTAKGINNIPRGTLTVAYYDNSAIVNVNGNISSGNDTKITADAITSIKEKSTAKMKGAFGYDKPDNGKAYLGASFAIGNSTATVNLNSKKEIKSTGNFSAAATTKPTIDVTATSDMSEDDTGAIGAAFNYVNDDSLATITVNAPINSGGKVTLDASQNITNSMSTDVSVGKADEYFDFIAKANRKYATSTNGYTWTQGLKNLFQNKVYGIEFNDANKMAPREGFSADQLSSVLSGESFKAGGALGYFGQKADTTVTINNSIKAGGDVNIKANSVISKINFATTSDVNNANAASESQTKNLIGGSFTISNINDNAKIVGSKSITAGGNVNIDSSAKMSYNPVKEHFKTVGDNLTKAKDSFTSLGTNIKNIFTTKNYKNRQEKLNKINEILKASEDKKSSKDKMTKEQYDYFMGIVEGLLDEYEAVKDDTAKRAEALKKLDDINSLLKDIGGELDDYAKEKLQTDKATELKRDSQFITNVSERVDSFMGVVDTYNNSVKAAKSITKIINPATYTNYYSRVQNVAKNPNTNDTNSISGALNFNRLNNRSTFLANNGFKIDAKKDVNINSNADTSTISLTGNGGMLGALSSSYGNSIGVQLNYQNVGGYSLVMLGNSNIKGKNVSVNSDNKASQVSIINSASTADGSNYKGLFNIVNGNSNAVTTVDNHSTINADKNLDIRANSDTNAYAINGSLNLGKQSTKHNVGVGAIWLDVDSNSVANVVNFKTVKDVNKDSIKAIADKDIANNLKLANKMVKDAGLTAPSVVNNSDKGSIKGNNINLNANSAGNQLALVLEGSFSTNSNSTLNSLVEGGSGVLGGAESLTKLADKYTKWPSDKVSKSIGNLFNPKDTPAPKPVAEKLERAQIPNAANSHVSASMSFAFKFGNSNTSAVLDNLTIDNSGSESKLNILTNDNSFRGALTGSGAVNFFSGDNVNNSSSKSLAGGIAINKSANDLNSIIRNSNISNSTLLTNVAQNSGTDIAVGLSGALNSSEGGSNQNAFNFDLSFNHSNNNVNALLIDTNLSGNKTALTNYAFNDKIQMSGGVNAHYSRGGLGGSNGSLSGAYSRITNTVNSGISGGKYEKLSGVDVQAIKAQMQLSGAVAVGVSSDNQAKEGSITVAVGHQENNSDAFIKNATIDVTEKSQSPVLEINKADDTDKYKAFHHYTDKTAKTEIFKKADNTYYTKAYATETFIKVTTTKKGKTTTQYKKATEDSDGTRYIKVDDKYVEALKDDGGYYYQKTYDGKIFVRLNDWNGGVNVLSYETKNNSTWQEYLTKRGYDLSGSSALGSDEKSVANITDLRGGSTNVIFAIGVNATSKNAGSLGVAVDYDFDHITSDLSNNTITAPFVNANTKRNLHNVSVATGVMVGKDGWAGASSTSINILDNKNKVTVTNNTIKTDNFNSIVRNDANIFNAAGQLSLAGTSAGGAAIAVNSMDNTATSKVSGGSIKPLSDSLNTKLDAKNDTTSTAIAAAGAKASKGSSGDFSFVFNFGKNSTESIIDKTPLEKINNLTVAATDKNKKTSIGGTVDYTKGAASIGVTYIQSGDSDEKLRAEVNNSTITTAKNNPKISVTADDDSRRRTWALSTGLTNDDKSIFTLKGSVANVYTDKLIKAAMTNSPVDTAGNGKSNLTIKAQNNSSNTTRAGIISLANSKVNLGIGLVRNSLRQNTLAYFTFDETQDKASTFYNFDLQAINNSELSTWAGGGTGSSKGLVNATGSFVYNYIGDKSGTGKVTAYVNNANIQSENNIGVVSQGDFALVNRAGSADVNMFALESSILSGGLTIAINDIAEQTTATVENSKLYARAKELKHIKVNDTIKDTAILNKRLLDKKQFMFGENPLKAGRQSRQLNGVVVNATSTHALANDVINIAGGSKFDIAAIFNHNYIKGKTLASLKTTTVEGGKDVNVRATDWSNIGTFQAPLTLAINVREKASAFGGGAIENGNTINREITSQVVGKENTQQKIDAKNFTVTAESKNGIVNTAGAVGLSFTQGTSGALGANLIHNSLNATTTAKVSNVEVNHSEKATVTADNLSRAYKTTSSGTFSSSYSGGSGAVGLVIDYLNQQSKSAVSVENATFKGKETNIWAKNYTDTDAFLGVVGLSFAKNFGISVDGTIGINYYDARTNVGIKNAKIEADIFKSNAENISNVNNTGGAISFGNKVGVGVNSVFNGLSASTALNVDSSTIKAKNTNLTAQEKRNVDVLDFNVSAGLVNLGLNYMATRVNKALLDDELVNQQVNNALKSLNEYRQKYKIENINEEQIKLDVINVALKAKVASGAGVNVNVKKSTIEGTDKLDVESTEQNRIHQSALGLNAGQLSAAVGIANIETKHAVGTTFNDSTLTGKEVSVNAGVGNYNLSNPINKQTLEDRNKKTANSSSYQKKLLSWIAEDKKTTAAQSGLYNFDFAAGFSIGPPDPKEAWKSSTVHYLPSEIKKSGVINTTFNNTNINATNKFNLEAADMTATLSRNVSIPISIGAAIEIIGATSSNEVATSVNFEGKGGTVKAQEINATATNAVNQHVITSGHIFGALVSIPKAETHVKDVSQAAVKIGEKYTFEGDKAIFTARNNPKSKSDSSQNVYMGTFQIAHEGAAAEVNSKAAIKVDDDNTFKVKDVEFNSLMGEKNKATVEVNHSADRWIAAGFTVESRSDARAETNTAATVDVGKEDYNFANVKINALNNSSRVINAKAFALLGSIQIAGGGTVESFAIGQDSAKVSADGGNVKNLDMNAQVYSYTDNYGRSIAPIGFISMANKAQVRNYFGGNANATLSGDWKADSIKVKAEHEDALDTMSDAGGVQVVGFTGVDNSLSIGKINIKRKDSWYSAAKTLEKIDLAGKETTSAKISDGTKIDAGNLSVNVKNTINTNKKDKYKFKLDAWMTPAVGGSWSKSEEVIKRDTQIDLGKDLNINTTGSQIYETTTTSNLKNNASATVWGLLGGGRLNTFTTAEFNNGIKVGSGSKFATTDTGNLTFSAFDTTKSIVISQSKYKGAIGFDTVSNAFNKVTRSNTIDVAKDAKLISENDINLYAGKSSGNATNTATLETTSEASNGSIAISTRPRFEITSDSANKLTLNGNATAKDNLNFYADRGKETVTKEAIDWSWGSSGDGKQVPISYTGDDVLNYSNKNDSAVTINGRATVGDANNLEVKISGEKDVNKNPGYDVTFTNGAGKELKNLKATQGTFNYADSLTKRWNELQDLIKVYETGKSGNVTIAQYAGYVQELALLEQKMIKVGLLNIKNGKKTLKQSAVEINYIELPDIKVSGGTLKITTPKLTGDGRLTVNTAPSAKIYNNSNAWLRVKNINVGSVGEGLLVNDTLITSAKELGGNLKLNFVGDKNGGILIDNSGAKTTKNGVATIEIAGELNAGHQDVTIKNPRGDVQVNASTDKTPTGINGRNVTITAQDFMQGYTAGTVHIGTSPEELYKKAVDKGATMMGKPQNFNKGSGLRTDIKNSARIMGGTVFIAADNINVNGLIQSGYDTYKVTVNQSDVDAAIAAAAKNDTSKSVVIGDKRLYKVNTSGGVWNDKGTYQEYVVQVYYDPTTKELLTADIDHAGGKVYLTGNIISTGNGKIMAADGGAEIVINNQSKVPLNVGKVLNNNSAGEINITQVTGNKTSRYSYKNGSATVIEDYGAYLKNPSNDKVKTLSDATKFNPTAETFYNWTVGNDITFIRHWEILYRAWNDKAARKLINDDNFLRNIGNDKKARFLNGGFGRASETTPLKSGTTVNVLKDAQKYDFKFGGDAKIVAYSVLNRRMIRTERKLIKDNDYRFEWDEKVKYHGTYVANIRADYPIDIGFIGKKDGSITITGNGGVNLTDTIRNNSSGAKMTVDSKKGISQEEGVDVYTNNAKLTATDDITGVDITAIDDKKSVELTATSDKGSIEAKVTGNVKVDKLETKSGKDDNYNKVELTATGDITGGNITSEGVELTSKNGKIDTQINQLKWREGNPSASNINATARGNITLTGGKGNELRLGTIKSTAGDVKISGYSIKDWLPNSSATFTNEDIKAKTARWVEAGLIAGKDRNNAYVKSLEQRVKDYEAEVTTDFGIWQNLKDTDVTTLDAVNKNYYDALKERFENYSSAKAYLQAQARDAESDYAQMRAEAKNPTYEWTADQLLYAVNDALINRKTGSTTVSDKLANVIGKNVTLEAKTNIGESKAASTITAAQLTGKDASKYLKQLAEADATSVEVVFDEEQKIKEFRLSGTSPIGIYSTGLLRAAANSSFIAARKNAENGNYTPLNVAQIDTKNLILQGKVGITNAADDIAIKVQTATLEGGTGDIGTQRKPLTTNAKNISAIRSEGNIFIRNAWTPMKVGSVYTRKNAFFDTEFALEKSQNNSAAYWDIGGELNLDGGKFGTTANPLQVKVGGILNATGDEINLFGVQQSDINFGNMETIGNINVRNNTGGLNVTGAINAYNLNLTASKDINVAGSIEATRNAILNSGQTIDISGNVKAPQVNLTAGRDINITGKLETDKLTTKAGGQTQITKPVSNHTVSNDDEDNDNSEIEIADWVNGITSRDWWNRVSQSDIIPVDTSRGNSETSTDETSTTTRENISANETINQPSTLANDISATTNETGDNSVDSGSINDSLQQNGYNFDRTAEEIYLASGGRLQVDLRNNSGFYFPMENDDTEEDLRGYRDETNIRNLRELYLGLDSNWDYYFPTAEEMLKEYAKNRQGRLHEHEDGSIHIRF